jgi:hypothetical protein
VKPRTKQISKTSRWLNSKGDVLVLLLYVAYPKFLASLCLDTLASSPSRPQKLCDRTALVALVNTINDIARHGRYQELLDNLSSRCT